MNAYDTLVEIGLVLANVEHNFQAEDALLRVQQILRDNTDFKEQPKPIGVPVRLPAPKGVLAEVLSRVC